MISGRTRRFLLKLSAFVRRGDAERQLAREIASHLQFLEDRFIAQGMSPDEAKLNARKTFGGVEQAKEYQRDARSFPWLEDLRRDVPYAARSFARNPGFTLAAVLTLALGIGAGAAVFSIINAVLLRPLSYADADRVVRIIEQLPPREGRATARAGHPLAIGELAAFRAESRTFSAAGMEFPRLMVMTGRGHTVRMAGSAVSAETFSSLGVAPILGRLFTGSEARPGAAAAILSHAAWRQHFDGRPDVLRESVVLDGRSFAIIGVMNASFQFPPGSKSQFWLPLQSDLPPAMRLPMTARLRDGVSIQAATEETTAIVSRLRPGSASSSPRLRVVPVKDLLVEPVSQGFLVVAAGVAFVLLIACVNVANLLLARTAMRQHELTLRLALGAGRGRLFRQFITEGVMLSLMGGAVGLALAAGEISLSQAMSAATPRNDMGPGINIPRLDEVFLDGAAIGVALLVALFAGLALGLVSALGQPRSSEMANLRSSSRFETSSSSLRHRHRAQSTLVIAEIAMAMLLFVGGALLLRSFVNMARVNPGFNPNGVLTFQVSLTPAHSIAQVTQFAEDLIARLQALPDVHAVGYAESLPMMPVGRGVRLGLTPDIPRPGSKSPPPSGLVSAQVPLDVRIVSRGFLDAMGTRLLSGRGLTESDGAGRPQVMLINETLARSGVLGSNPIGRHIYAGGNVTFDPGIRSGAAASLEPWEIVGIVEDVHQLNIATDPSPQLFVDQRQLPGPTGGTAFNVAVRHEGPIAPVSSSLRTIVADLDDEALLENVAPMSELVSSTLARPRLYTVFLSLFAGIAASLAAVGIYGVMSFAVTRRTREIGVRVALGARRSQVVRLVVGQSAALTLAGILLGTAGAVASARLLEGMLFGVSPLDPGTFIAVALAFAALAAIAAFVPARRASSVDPVIALRCE